TVTSQGQTRYLDSLFTSTVTSDVIYGNNIDIRTGSPVAMDLKMDVYEPTGDACLSRPLVIFLHAGTYLPILYNDACTGTKTDSSIAETCRQFAYRGYVAVSMDYRVGWTPLSTNQDTVTGSLFQAAYRT